MAKPIDQEISLKECDYFVVSAGAGSNDVFENYDRLRQYVVHEDDLINSRLTWSLTIHGFLFAIYGLLLGKAADLFAQLAKSTIPNEWVTLEHVITGLLIFQLPVAIFGIVVGLKSEEATVAAHNAIQHLLAISKGIPGLACPSIPGAAGGPLLPRIVGGGDKGDHTKGARSYYLALPVWAKWIWIVLFLASSCFCILSLFFRLWFFSVIAGK